MNGFDRVELAAAALVLRCYSGSSRTELVLPDGRVVESGSPGGDDLAALTGVPARAHLRRAGGELELAFDSPIAEPYLRCIAEDLATVLARLRAGHAEPLPAPASERLGRCIGPPAASGPDRSIPELFWLHVQAHPARPAVAGETELSYAALGERVAGYAALLGARSGERVGLLLDHGADMVAAILATLTVGAVYVPLDPRYPVPRLRAMAAQAQVSAVLTATAHRPLAERLASQAQILDVSTAPSRDAAGFPPVDPHEPAYILHTSGSTGLPKGVVQTHRNVLHQVRLHRANLRITSEDRVSVVSSFAFDMAVTDTFSALLSGACCVPVDVRALGLAGLADALRRHRVTIYHSTPTVFRYLAGYLAESARPRLPDVRVAVLGGEPVTSEDVERCRRHLAPDGVLVNGYGATEISFAVQNHLPLAAEDGATPGGDDADDVVVPIGYPLDGVRIGLLAADGSPSAVAGEVAISSDHLAGYWAANPEDAARFDTDHAGVRRYRTGDLARRLPDGRLVYLGRRDRQVKVRGYRVEPAEVEFALAGLPGIAHAAVVAERTGDEQRLRAFVVATDPRDGALDPAAIRDALAERLPEFMVPATITVVPELPLTPTGKIDATALLERHAKPTPPPPATGSLQDLIVAAWSDVLGRRIGPDDRFFDVGGHSLLAAKVHHRLVAHVGRDIPLAAMYTHPTAASLAGYLGGPDERPAATQVSLAADRMARRRAARAGRNATN